MRQIYVWNLIEECVRLDREIERLMDKLEKTKNEDTRLHLEARIDRNLAKILEIKNMTSQWRL